MKKNDPRRNLIPTWHWGDCVEVYTDPRKAPRWVLNRGALRDPCDVAGCKRLVMKGEWYIRHPFLGVVCRDCSVGFGVVPSEAMDRGCRGRSPLRMPGHEGSAAGRSL